MSPNPRHDPGSVPSCFLAGIDARLVTIAAGAQSDPRSRRLTDQALLAPYYALATVGARPPPSGIWVTPEPSPSSRLDLAAALAVLAHTGQIPCPSNLLVVGELGLGGEVRSVRGALAAALLAKSRGLRGLIVPSANAWEGMLAGVEVWAVSDLASAMTAVVAASRGWTPVPAGSVSAPKQPDSERLDMSDVRGQDTAVRTIATLVATGRNILLSGPPGSQKTMLARRVTTLLPDMSREEVLEVTQAFSAVGMAFGPCTRRPFRAPHHTISRAGLVGNERRPGELQLAAYGVLYLDELHEFPAATIGALGDALRGMSAASRPQIVTSTNPCPCGWFGTNVRRCACSVTSVARNRSRVWALCQVLGIEEDDEIHVSAVSLEDMRSTVLGPTSAELRAPTDHEGAAGALCIDDGTGCCRVCGVALDRCNVCRGIGYHRAACVESGS